MSAHHNYNETQLKILAILPHVTGTLSALGSFTIIYDIWKNRDKKMKQPYYRILLGLSLFDFLSSTSLALSTIPMPVDTPGVFGAKGTTQTCTAAGFFVQLSGGSMIYNLIRSIYYTLSGRYKMTDDEFAKKCEPYMHGFAIMLTLGIAIAGIPLTIYNPTQFFCWIAPYPLACLYNDNPDLECERGRNAGLYRWIFTLIPSWIIIICITMLMGMLTLNVRKEEKDTIDRRNVGIEYTPRFEEEKKSNDSNENDNEQLSKLGPELDDTHNKSKHSTNRQFSREESFRLERTKEIFHQALMYVGVFYLTWTAPTIGSALRIDSDRIPAYPISVLIILLLSLQGFWNWLIYRRGPCLV